MYDCMKQYFPAGLTFTYPQGGLFTWVTLPEGMDAKALMPKALAKNVAYVPGNPFYPNGGNANHFRMNYSVCRKTASSKASSAWARSSKKK